MSDKGKAVKAVLDARGVSFELFGPGQGAHVRKLVFLYLATWADPDGTHAYPSRTTIAGDCGLTVRGLSNALAWLQQRGLISVEYKGSPRGTNKYSLLLSADSLEAARLKMVNDTTGIAIREKRESTRQTRRESAKAFWNSPKGKDARARLAKRNCKGDQERSIPGVLEQDGEHSILGDQERSVPGALGTFCMGPGTQRSSNRPLDRPKGPESETVHAEQTAKAALSPADADNCEQTEQDASYLDAKIFQTGIGLTGKVQEKIRSHLRQGVPKEMLERAVKRVQEILPRAEKSPGLYLQQNFDVALEAVKRGLEKETPRDRAIRQAFDDGPSMTHEEREQTLNDPAYLEQRKQILEKPLAASAHAERDCLQLVWDGT